MYRAFFQLKSKPFETTADSAFLWLGEKYKEALAALRYGVLENKGFLLMTGDAGIGKTTLVRALTEGLDNSVLWAVINDPKRQRLDFYNGIARGFGIAKEFSSKVQFLIQFSHFLHTAAEEGKKVLLLIDDCQLLSQEMLEELRLLSNIEKDDAKLINIFFVGQRQFNEMLSQPSNRAVRQRLALRVDLPALTSSETEEYILHRLKVAGSEEKIFSAKAMGSIHRASMGIPKRINSICEHALVAGGTESRRILDHKNIEESLGELKLPLAPAAEEAADLPVAKSPAQQVHDKKAAGLADELSATSSDRLETPRGGWWKYTLAAVLLAAISVSFVYLRKKSPEVAAVEPRAAVQQTSVKEVAQVIASPALAVLEENKSVINEKKAAELKHSILLNAYSSNENGRQGAMQSPASGDMTKTQIGMQADTADSGSTTGKEKEHPAQGEGRPTGIETAKAVVIPQGEEKTTVPGEQVKVGQAVQKVPDLPNTLILPLAADSLKLTEEASRELKDFIKKLQFHPGAQLLIKGFVASGTESPQNTRLSLERAMAVEKLLLAGGIDAARLQVKGMGNQEPIASNSTSDGRKKNRRVEVVVIGNGR